MDIHIMSILGTYIWTWIRSRIMDIHDLPSNGYPYEDIRFMSILSTYKHVHELDIHNEYGYLLHIHINIFWIFQTNLHKIVLMHFDINFRTQINLLLLGSEKRGLQIIIFNLHWFGFISIFQNKNIFCVLDPMISDVNGYVQQGLAAVI